MPSQIRLDVAPINVESQPISSKLQIETPKSCSPTQSLDVDIILLSHTDSPSLKLMEAPYSKSGEHHLLDDLLAHQTTFSVTASVSVASRLKSISIESIAITTSTVIPSTSSENIFHPLTSVSSSKNMPKISHLLTIIIHH